MYLKDHIWMALVGIISVIYGVNYYLDNSRLDLMSIVFTVLSVLYFVALTRNKDEQ